MILLTNLLLSSFDDIVLEFYDAAATGTDQMVMMLTIRSDHLKETPLFAKGMLHQNAAIHQEPDGPIHGCNTDAGIHCQHPLIKLIDREMIGGIDDVLKDEIAALGRFQAVCFDASLIALR